MSDSVSIIKDIYAAFGRGDIAFIMTRIADDVVWEMEGPTILSFAGIRHGLAETAGFFEGIAKDHDNPKLEMTDFVSNDDVVAAFGRYEATMKETRIRVSTPVAHYFRLRDGKIVHYRNFINTAAFVAAMQPGAAAAAR